MKKKKIKHMTLVNDSINKSGYVGKSMSINAVKAYELGEKPISKWTKQEILNKIYEKICSGKLVLKIDFNQLYNAPLTFLRAKCLRYTGWHHTGVTFQKTLFYEIDIEYLQSLTESLLIKEITSEKIKTNLKSKTDNDYYFADVNFKYWERCRKGYGYGHYVIINDQAVVYQGKVYLINERKCRSIDEKELIIMKKYGSKKDKKIPKHFNLYKTERVLHRLKLKNKQRSH